MRWYTDRPEYHRSTDYRKRYFRKHKGFTGIYCCPYCGKLLTEDTATVDHIIPVNAAKKSFLLRLLLRNTDDGINNMRNLTVACWKCNSKKSSKCGVWILRGKLGKFIFPIFWMMFFALFPYALSWGIAFIKVCFF